MKFALIGAIIILLPVLTVLIYSILKVGYQALRDLIKDKIAEAKKEEKKRKENLDKFSDPDYNPLETNKYETTSNNSSSSNHDVNDIVPPREKSNN